MTADAMGTPSLLDALPTVAELIADRTPEPHTLWCDPERGHVAIEANTPGASGEKTALILCNVGPALNMSAWPRTADITPDQALELAAHLTAWANRQEDR
ncbi:hypothetical protein [Serinibacter salmoneus]|uniref:Uncharacterized protein n=1 Tax=Serinibacter salmoneus TaxID=556530 RepID=A0A2A9D1W9_9MICO|nr:hypothetical protein [Serinibacter salmoneus]PFG19849.1 hypothetical protein ATL40_1425 [Serinibacter salmoneus]